MLKTKEITEFSKQIADKACKEGRIGYLLMGEFGIDSSIMAKIAAFGRIVGGGEPNSASKTNTGTQSAGATDEDELVEFEDEEVTENDINEAVSAIYAKIDTNSDGIITGSELEGYKSAFESAGLTQDELLSFLSAMGFQETSETQTDEMTDEEITEETTEEADETTDTSGAGETGETGETDDPAEETTITGYDKELAADEADETADTQAAQETSETSAETEEAIADETEETDKTDETDTAGDEENSLSNSEEIEEFLNSLSISTKYSLLEQLGGEDEILSVIENKDGTHSITTKTTTATYYPLGNFTLDIDNEEKTGEENYDEQGRLIHTQYVDHTQEDVVIEQTIEYNEDNSAKATITNSNEPNIQKIVEISSEGEITKISSVDTITGETNVEFDSNAPSNEASQDSIAAENEELAALYEEQAAVEDDLTAQEDTYDETSSEMDTALSDIDSEVETTEDDLSTANDDLDEAAANEENAQSEAANAGEELSSAEAGVDNAQTEVEDTTQAAETAQDNEEEAASDNQDAIAAENDAASDADDASSDLEDAIDDTTDAADEADDAQSDYNSEVTETGEAFSALNQAQEEVDSAQNEYDNAKAAKAESEGSFWNKIKGFFSSIVTALDNAINHRDKAEAELEKQQKEEEEARVISEEAQTALEEKEEEQARAQEVSDNAQIILERKTGEREITDQEYADALLDLADAMLEQENAQGEYDSAMEQYMAAYDYSVDAEGNLVNAQGEKVSAEQVVEELETFVQELASQRTDTESSYTAALDTTLAAISGDETELENLSSEISALEEEIAQEQANIAMYEQMLTELSTEQGEINAAEAGGGVWDDIQGLFGFGNAKTQKNLDANSELLEKALLSGNAEDIQAAYQAIYGDVEYTDENGNTKKVSAMSDAELEAYMESESQSAAEAQNTVEAIQNGEYTYNGQTLTLDDITASVVAQAQEYQQAYDDAVSQQGVISKATGFINNGLGIGTSSNEAEAQVEQYLALVEELQNCTDPVRYAALYKSITGDDLDIDKVVSSLAYTQTVNGTTAETSDEANDLSSYVNAYTEAANGESDALKVIGDTTASEKILDYQETQETLTDSVKGIIVATGSMLAVAATPFTGGASLALAAAVGAGLNVGLSAVDSVYDGDNDGTLDVNYTLKEAAKDALTGAITAASNVGSNALGQAVAKSLGKEVVTNAGTTITVKYGAKTLGNLVEGTIDGAVSSSSAYLLDVATGDKEFSLEQLLETTGQGALMGGIMNVGMGALMDVATGNFGKSTDYFTPNTSTGGGADGDNLKLIGDDDVVDGDYVLLDGDDVVDGGDIKVKGDNVVDGDDVVGTQGVEPVNKQDMLDVMNKLEKEGKLPDNINYKEILDNPGEIDQNLYNDLVKLSNMDGDSIVDTFVPRYDSLEEAMAKLNNGETCRATINGTEKHLIKTSSGLAELNISAETYMDLFPPVQRYATMQSPNCGDCYFICTADALYKDGDTTYGILKCFSEDADGVKVTVGNTTRTLDDALTSAGERNLSGCNGMIALENTYGINRIDSRIKTLTETISNESGEYTQEAIEKAEKRLRNINNALANGDEFMAGSYAIEGGYQSEVCKTLKISQDIYSKTDLSSIYLEHTSSDYYGHFLVTGGYTDKLFVNSELKIAANHAYSLSVVTNSAGEKVYKVTNPWSCGNQLWLSADQIQQYFSCVFYFRK